MTDALPRDVEAAFGHDFARQLTAIDGDGWQGPLTTSYGLHLVRITHRGEPTRATVADARDVIAREWSRAQTVETERAVLPDAGAPLHRSHRTGRERSQDGKEVERMLRRWAVAIALVLTGATAVRADVFRPAYLELRETSAETYDVMWKVPAQGDTLRLAIHVVFPEGTVNCPNRAETFVGDGFVERWTIRRAGGLADGKVRIDGLPGSITDVLARDRTRGRHDAGRATPARTACVCRRAIGARHRCRLDLPGTRRSPHPGRHRPLALHPGDALPGQGLATDRRDDVSVYRDPQFDVDRGGARAGSTCHSLPSRRASR